MESFERFRKENSVSIVSFSNLKDLSDLYSHPFLILTAQNMNSQNFSGAFAHILSEEDCTLFIETKGLTVVGEKRLINILNSFLKIFDNRVRIILLTPNESVKEPFRKFVEKEFSNSKSRKEPLDNRNYFIILPNLPN